MTLAQWKAGVVGALIALLLFGLGVAAASATGVLGPGRGQKGAGIGRAAHPRDARGMERRGMGPRGDRDDDARQARRGRSERGPGGPLELSDAERAAALEKIRALRVYQLTELLGISGEPAQAFFSHLATWDEQQFALQKERRENMRALRQALSGEAPVSPEALTALVDASVALDQREAASRAALIDGARDDLTPEQLARFAVYQRDFERRLRKLMRVAASGAKTPELEEALEELKEAGRGPGD